jgi:lactate permease
VNFILALVPLLIILYLMVGRRWGASQAGGAGYLGALAIAVAWFGAGPRLLAYAHAKALILSLDVLLIIWAAFLQYRVADEAGAIRTIGQFLPHLTADRGMQAIIIGWVFASFLQGVGGFGVPVAVIAPILGGLGFTPLAAVVVPSIGHGWAVTFGSLGSSFQALISATNLTDTALAPAAAIFLGAAGLLTGLLVVHAAAGWAAIRRLWAPILLVGLGMAVIQFGAAVSGLWNIAAFCGGIAGLIIVVPLARRFQREDNPEKMDGKALTLALSGYAILIAITLSAQLIPPLQQFLGQVVFQVQFPQISTDLGYITPAGLSRRIPVFRHAGMLLAYSSVLSYWNYRRAGLYKPGATVRILSGTVQRVLASSVSIVSMVTMAVVMEHAGMTDALARGLAESMGAIFPLTAPWIGALGAFMTGSNTNSNVMFGALQLRTANLLGYAATIILAGQTAGAAVASVMAPTKVVVGASTAGMAGREGEVMRSLLGYAGMLILLISILTLGTLWLTG